MEARLSPQLYSAIQEGAGGFAPRSRLLEIWTPETLERFAEDRHLNLPSPSFIDDIRENFLQTISILVFVHFRRWEHFDELFFSHQGDDGQLDRTDLHIPDYDLPTLQRVLGFEVGYRFFKYRHLFCPVDIEEGSGVRRDKGWKLPFLSGSSELYINGGAAQVSKQVVAARHYRSAGVLSTAGKTVVLKVYISQPDYERELANFKILRECRCQHDHICLPISSAIIGNELSILFPYAGPNLETFLTGTLITTEECDMGEVLGELIGLADALNYLHTSLGSNFRCCHGNLKPSNILLSKDLDIYKYSRVGRWKIADFGLSTISQVEEKFSVEGHSMTSPSAIAHPRKTGGVYQAPEVVYGHTVTSHSDVWSFGCILVRVFAFLLQGLEGLRRLDYIRLRDDDGVTQYEGGHGRFHRGSPPVLNTHISGWIMSIANNRSEDNFLLNCAVLLGDCLRIGKFTRPTTENVVNLLKQLRFFYYRDYNQCRSLYPATHDLTSSAGSDPTNPSLGRSPSPVLQSSVSNALSLSGLDISNRVPDLILAIKSQDPVRVKKCLIRSVDIEGADSDGYTPLGIAARLGEESIVRHLLAAHVDVNTRSVGGQTPLMIGIFHDQINIARLLLENGADCMAYSDEGLTCLHYAASSGSFESIQLLVQYLPRVDIRTQGANEETPLLTLIKGYSRAKRWEDKFRALLSAGADVNQVDKSGRSPLIYAVEEGYTNAVKLLLEHNADATSVPLSGMHISREVRVLLKRYATEHQLIGNESRLRRVASSPSSSQEGPFRGGVPTNPASVLNHSEDRYFLVEKLQAIGYDMKEIDNLLRENERDSPWIYFDPTIPPQHEMQIGHHIHRCCHSSPWHRQPEAANGPVISSSNVELTADDREDTIRTLEELCGLGGISPSTRNLTDWLGTAKFDENRDAIAVVYSPSTDGLGILSTTNIESRISRPFAKLCSALGLLQAEGLCCDSFTVIKYQEHSKAGGIPIGEIVSVSFQIVADLAAALNEFLDTERFSAMKNLSDRSKAILTLIMPEREISARFDPVKDCLHYSALAVQFLCLGLLTYVQAHIGPIQPFFLDTAISMATIWGTKEDKIYPHLVAKLVDITCLNEMTHGPVWMFFNGREEVHDSSGSSAQANEKCDIVGQVCDILDTWGPGNLVYRRDEPIFPVAVQIGGGFIFRSNGTKFHWAQEIDQTAVSRYIDPEQQIRIGALTSKNQDCILDEGRCRRQSANVLEYLGTSTTSWVKSQRQIGLHVIGQYFETWNKQRGVSVKEIALSMPDEELIQYLDEYWGVQVSYCTGVARRVLLRTVISDLLRAFPGGTEPDLQPLESAMRNSSCKPRDLLNSLLQSLRQRALDIVRAILDDLKPTGLDSTGKYFCIAWPFEGDLSRCFKVPLEGQSSWARFLADSHDTATFAYITMDCLETDSVRCRGTQELRQDDMYLLETAVTRTTRDNQAQWTLKHEEVYFFSKLESSFWVKVQREQEDRPAGLVELMFLESLPRDIRQRLYMREKKKQRGRLRERPTIWADGEPVSVSSVRRIQ